MSTIGPRNPFLGVSNPSQYMSCQDGCALLMKLHSHPTEYDLDVYQRAYSSIISGRTIAVDLDDTLANLGWKSSRFAAWHLLDMPEKEARVLQENLDGSRSRLRHLPHRGMQALLLGLWSAGNNLKLYTHYCNEDKSVFTSFFNKFPLLKLSFGLTNSEAAEHPITADDLSQASQFLDFDKNADLVHQHFSNISEECKKNLEPVLKDPFFGLLKFPFPEFPFDVLVDNNSEYLDPLQFLGVGFIHVYPNDPQLALSIVDQLKSFFAKPLPERNLVFRL